MNRTCSFLRFVLVGRDELAISKADMGNKMDDLFNRLLCRVQIGFV